MYPVEDSQPEAGSEPRPSGPASLRLGRDAAAGGEAQRAGEGEED